MRRSACPISLFSVRSTSISAPVRCMISRTVSPPLPMTFPASLPNTQSLNAPSLPELRMEPPPPGPAGRFSSFRIVPSSNLQWLTSIKISLLASSIESGRPDTVSRPSPLSISILALDSSSSLRIVSPPRPRIRPTSLQLIMRISASPGPPELLAPSLKTLPSSSRTKCATSMIRSRAALRWRAFPMRSTQRSFLSGSISSSRCILMEASLYRSMSMRVSPFLPMTLAQSVCAT
mmetsp:Transcript_105363/g.187327  ORF Transcript_105363/g.187327 Transcript_105363/m.187327 type:complete len:234 (+) Transcript_105363:757-1458(+)